MGAQAGTSEELIWGHAFCLSIYFMLAVIHVIIFGVAYKVYKVIRAEDRKYGTGQGPRALVR